MKQLILLVRKLRAVLLFKISARIFSVGLMLVGAWVATRTLEIPEGFAINDKLIHVVVFFGFSMLMDLSISRHPFWLWKGLPLLVYGIAIEIMQYYSPERTFSLLDWAADFFGILLYFMIKILVLKMSLAKNDNS